jgi:hypothetical protein
MSNVVLRNLNAIARFLAQKWSCCRLHCCSDWCGASVLNSKKFVRDVPLRTCLAAKGITERANGTIAIWWLLLLEKLRGGDPPLSKQISSLRVIGVDTPKPNTGIEVIPIEQVERRPTNRADSRRKLIPYYCGLNYFAESFISSPWEEIGNGCHNLSSKELKYL